MPSLLLPLLRRIPSHLSSFLCLGVDPEDLFENMIQLSEQLVCRVALTIAPLFGIASVSMDPEQTSELAKGLTAPGVKHEQALRRDFRSSKRLKSKYLPGPIDER